MALQEKKLQSQARFLAKRNCFANKSKKLITKERLKNLANAAYFDEVLVDTIDNRFLKMDTKGVHGICSKPIPMFPVDKKLYQSK